MTEKDVVGVCEFTEEDSVVGVRVAASSRMTKGRKGVRKKGDAISERVNARVLEVSEAAETLPGDALPVRTYEKGEVVVSIEGKILPVTSFEPFLSRSVVEGGVVSAIEEHTEDERASSVGSIEEPDVLECWEAEIVEPISTQKVVDSNDNTDSDNTVRVIIVWFKSSLVSYQLWVFGSLMVLFLFNWLFTEFGMRTKVLQIITECE